MPVYQLLEEMPNDELMNWFYFFSKRPIGWREDQRTYLMLRTQGVKEKAEVIFPTLKQIYASNESSQKADRAVPKGKFLEMMMKSKNGDGSGWKPNLK